MALVPEVSVEIGEIRAHKVTLHVNPELLINPNGAVTQIQDSIIMGLSSTLIEEVSIEDWQLATNNFNKVPAGKASQVL